MSVQFAPVKLTVPPGFDRLLTKFCREVLRNQPDDIIAFGAKYFADQLSLRESGSLSPELADVKGDGHELDDTTESNAADLDAVDDKPVEAEDESGNQDSMGSAADAEEEGCDEEEDIEQQEWAAVKIQAGFKGYKTRGELKKTQQAKENLAASKIQAGFRGHKARGEVNALKKQAAVEGDVEGGEQ
ncbi:PREDICTED: sperm surface protein Sp17-like isoform X2 [Priapulus caudatus]|nr:PREDICTED: sperm surface protein Sp17-like isoform X2 [Priapulus caudatus]XP_014673698.1 PREDICTED: sperm surface protein Sp17-like isoform X2 [Priapulus caudatus]